MNSLEIQYFLTIVKYGSFTEAAQALSVSQPAISKQIRQLEAELDWQPLRALRPYALSD